MEPRYHKSVKSYAPVNRLRWISVCKMFTGQHCQKQPLLLLKNTGLDKERIYFVFQFQQRPQPIPWNFWSFRLKSLCTLWCAIWWECKLVQPLWKTVWKFLWIFTECGLSYSITTETSKEIQSSRTVHHLKKKKKEWLPWWSSCQESARQCSGRGFSPSSGKISQAKQLISSRA